MKQQQHQQSYAIRQNLFVVVMFLFKKKLTLYLIYEGMLTALFVLTYILSIKTI